MKKLLLVDDDPVTAEAISKAIANEFSVFVAVSVASALSQIETGKFDIFIIDRGLPDGDGLSICEKIRSSERLNNCPILFLSGKGSEPDRVTGLYAGADDYIVKPISITELKARLHARLRTQGNQKISGGDIELDTNSFRAFGFFKEGKRELDLTRIEFKILSLFLRNPDRVYSREALLDLIWGQVATVNDRVVDTHISHLRKKISWSKVNIKSIPKEGYRLEIKDI